MKLFLFDSRSFCSKNYFEDDGSQNYLVFQPVYWYFNKIGNSIHISEQESNGFADDESIGSPTTSDNRLALSLNYVGVKPRKKFDSHCLKQDKFIFTHKR